MILGRAVSWTLLSAFTLVANLTFASAGTLTGRASIVDGDTIEIQRQRVRILDIDAPEASQTCTDWKGFEWHCGQEAAVAIADWIGHRTVASKTTKKERFGRWLARCSVGNADLAERMANEGWAVAFRDCKSEVVRQAAYRAKVKHSGIWSGMFTLPWEWRERQAASTGATSQGLFRPAAPTQAPSITPSVQAPEDCLINGNISS